MPRSTFAYSPRPVSLTVYFIGFALCLLLACLTGILARPTGFLSSFWPANGVLLGMLLRWPELAQRTSWLIASAVFVLADLVTGSSLLAAVWLTAANLTGVACGWWFLQRLDTAQLQLRQQTSVLYLLAGCVIAAAGASLVGAGAGVHLFASHWLQSALMWFSTELMNFMLIVPVILSLPECSPRRWLSRVESRVSWKLLLPLLFVLATEYAALALGGPGAMAFSVPALLWCALSYSLFTTALLGLVVCTWKVATLSMGIIDFTPADVELMVSLCFGLTLLSMGPLAVAGAQLQRAEQLQRLNRAASHDSLTDVLARGAFMDQGQRLLERLQHEGSPVAVLMLDLDHFKRVNDSHGHAAGDALLRACAKTMLRVSRPQDLLGRIGGEEFAMLLPGVPAAAAEQIATRICAAVRSQRVALRDGPVLRATVSVGIAWNGGGTAQTLEELLRRADIALYDAKAAGRDGWQRHHASPARAALAAQV
ncbi:GGDEF domain-containing protein [Comamonas antarctica]|uniref:diguanylate cyclase n=1 Tax=Comamonas antarctica TaxID=2743470 RepID=A0A6N1X5F6_9BURK|nr:GGDEF domain-containing protein [Comamonas antarctica]QKV54547.1 diguanylate cyclase [Comamonas antarctica]